MTKAEQEQNVKLWQGYNRGTAQQREVFSRLDSAMSLLEKLPYFADDGISINLDTPSGSYGFYTNGKNFGLSASPLAFLFNIIQALGVDEGTLKEWIIELLVRVLPAVEVGVKASLLANIKSIVSCSSDPRIPLKFRKRVGFNSVLGNNALTDIDRGIKIPVAAIDPNGILNLSPFTEPGLLKYFGCMSDTVYDEAIRKKTEVPYSYGPNIIGDIVKQGNGNVRKAKLARADDFNAFLWFVMHNGNKKLPTKIRIRNNQFTFKRKTYTVTKGKNLLGTLNVQKPTDIPETDIIPGDSFYDPDNPNLIGMCLKNSYAADGETPTGNTIVPISSDWYSCNWYVDKSNYYSANLGFKQKADRDYSKEKAICNLRYFKRSESPYVDANLPEYFKFYILPKPYVLLPSLNANVTGTSSETSINQEVDNDGNVISVTTVTTTALVEPEVNWRVVRLLFNAEGDADSHGKFSLNSDNSPTEPTLTKVGVVDDIATYNIRNSHGTQLKFNIKTGKYWLYPNKDHLESFLVECYPGLTVYEFNYDYIMGMKLFDPKVVCQQLFENSLNPAYNANFEMSFNKLKDTNNYPYFGDKQRLIGIISNILNEDDDEINDCFYTFSNEQFEEMLKKTTEKKYHEQPFNQGYAEGESFDLSEVYKTLSEYPETGTLKDQIDVINKAIEQTCGIFDKQKKVLATADSSTLKTDFLTDILQKLVLTIVDAILSPKLLMLLIVNEQLMGDQGEPTSTDALMSAMKGLVKGLIREIRDLIMQKLLDYIIGYLTPMAVQMKAEIGKEQMAAYMALIRLLFSWFNSGKSTANNLSGILKALFKRLRKKKKYNTETEIDLPTVLDEITYADIFDTDGTVDAPIINNC